MTALAKLEAAIAKANAKASGPTRRVQLELHDAETIRAALPPAELGGVDYVAGELDRTAPPRIWLQIDTSGDNDSRDDPWPGPDHVTWQDESIGGLEIEYVRADLSTPRAAEAVTEEVFAIVRPYLQPEAREKVRAALIAALTPPSAKGE